MADTAAMIQVHPLSDRTTQKGVNDSMRDSLIASPRYATVAEAIDFSGPQPTPAGTYRNLLTNATKHCPPSTA